MNGTRSPLLGHDDALAGMNGYLTAEYAASLSALGTPSRLPKSGGFILKRRIPGSPLLDGMGPYPLFCCADWSRLPEDLMQVGTEIVSLALVADPFGSYELGTLRECFQRVAPFKKHFVADLSRPLERIVSPHHRKHARKGLRKNAVERCLEPPAHSDEWITLYGDLTRRKQVRGPAAIGEQGLIRQLSVPGLVMFRATIEGCTTGLHLWYVCQDVAYAHLGAYNDRGYETGASYALFWTAFQYFQGEAVKWVHLGGSAGLASSGSDGLSDFKAGWSTESRTAYFCGRICNEAAYRALVGEARSPRTDYFPAYRT